MSLEITKTTNFLLAMIALCIFFLSGCSDDSNKQKSIQDENKKIQPVQKTELLSTPKSEDPYHVSVSKDGKRYAAYGPTLIVDGKTVFEGKGEIDRFKWSPDGKNYVGLVDRTEKHDYIITKDHRSPHPCNSSTFRLFTWGGSSERYVYTSKGDPEALVVNGKTIDRVDHVPRKIWVPSKNNFYLEIEKDEKEYLYIGTDQKRGPYKNVSFRVTASGDPVVMTEQEDDRSYIQYKGEKMGPYGHLFISLANDKSDWFTFTNRYEKENGEYVIVNGNEYGPYDEVRSDVLVNPEGEAGFIVKGSPDKFVVDGRVRETVRAIHSFDYARDGSGWIYAVRNESGNVVSVRGARSHDFQHEGGRVVDLNVHQTGTWGAVFRKWDQTGILFQGKNHGPYSGYPGMSDELYFSPDGQHFSLQLDSRTKSEDGETIKREFLVIDGTKYQPKQGSFKRTENYTKTGPYPLRYGPPNYVLFDRTGERFWYVTENEDTQQDGIIYKNGTEWFRASWLHGVYISPGQRYLAFRYIESGQGQEMMKIDGKTYSGKEITGITFSEKHKSYAFRIQQENGEDVLVINGTRTASYSAVSDPRFVDNTVVVVVNDGEQIIKHRYELRNE